MKKIISILTIALCLFMALPAQAQSLKFGVKGGLNLSKLDFENVEENKTNSTGFFIGPMAEVSLPLGLGVDAALMYSQRGKDDFKQQGIEVPVNAKLNFGLGSMLGMYIAAGPDFFFNFKDIDLKGVDSKKAQVGLNLGAGVKLLRHLQAGVNYQFGLGDSFNLKNIANGNNEAGAKYNTWQVSVAYMF